MRRRVLAGSGTIYKIPNGVYQVYRNSKYINTINDQKVYQLYKVTDSDKPSYWDYYSKQMPWLLIKESDCAFLLASPYEDDVKLNGDSNGDFGSWENYQGFSYYPDRQAVQNSQIMGSNYDSWDTIESYLIDRYIDNGHFSKRYDDYLDFHGFSGRIPTYAEAQMIVNRLSEIKASIPDTYKGNFTFHDFDGKSIFIANPESAGRVWRYAINSQGMYDSDTYSYVYGLLEGFFYVGSYGYTIYVDFFHVRPKEVVSDEYNYEYTFTYKGIPLTWETWGTDDIGYLPGQSSWSGGSQGGNNQGSGLENNVSFWTEPAVITIEPTSTDNVQWIRLNGNVKVIMHGLYLDDSNFNINNTDYTGAYVIKEFPANTQVSGNSWTVNVPANIMNQYCNPSDGMALVSVIFDDSVYSDGDNVIGTTNLGDLETDAGNLWTYADLLVGTNESTLDPQNNNLLVWI